MSVLRKLARKNSNSPFLLCNFSRFFNTQNSCPFPDEPNSDYYDDLVNVAGRNRDFAALHNLLNKRVRDNCFNTRHTFDFITNTEADPAILDKLSQTLGRLAKGFPRKSAFDSLIARLCKLNRVDESLRVVDTMIRSNFGVNASTFHPILNILTRRKRMEAAWRVMTTMKESGASPDVTAYNYILTAYCFAGDVAAAARVLEEMDEKGAVADARTYDALVLGACRAGKAEGALVLLRRMQDDGVPAMYSTHAHVINALVKLGYYAQAVEFVKLYGGRDKKLDEESFGLLGSRLIKLTRFEEAKVVLGEMKKRGLVLRSLQLQNFYELHLTQNF